MNTNLGQLASCEILCIATECKSGDLKVEIDPVKKLLIKQLRNRTPRIHLKACTVREQQKTGKTAMRGSH